MDAKYNSYINFYQEGKYQIAAHQYTRVIALVDGYFKDEEKEKRDPLKLAGHLNLAACHLKLNSNFKCIKECEKVCTCSFLYFSILKTSMQLFWVFYSTVFRDSHSLIIHAVKSQLMTTICMVHTIFKRSWILAVVLKSSWIWLSPWKVLYFFIRS